MEMDMDCLMETGGENVIIDESIEDIVNKIVHENIGNDEILITKNILQDQVQDNELENHQTSPSPATATELQSQVNNDIDNGYQNHNYEKPEESQTMTTSIGENHGTCIDVDNVVDNIVNDIMGENENDIQIQIKNSVDILEENDHHDHGHHQNQTPEKPPEEKECQSQIYETPCNQEQVNEIAGLICANCYCTINRKEDCRLFSEQLFLSSSRFNIKSSYNDNDGGNATILEAILEIYESKWSVNFKTYKEYQEFTSNLYMCWNCLFILANLYKLFKEFQDISACSNSLIEKYINMTTKLDDCETNKCLKRPAAEVHEDQEIGIKLINVSSLAPGQNNEKYQSQNVRVSTESGNSSADQLFDDFQKFGGVEEYDYDGSDNNISIDEKFIVPSIQEELHQNQNNPASNNNYFSTYSNNTDSNSNCNQQQQEKRNLRNRNRNSNVEISSNVQDTFSHFMDYDQNNYQDPYGELNNIMGGGGGSSSSCNSKVENNDQSNKKGNNCNSNRYDDQQPSTSTGQGTSQGQRRGRGRPRKCVEQSQQSKPPLKQKGSGSGSDQDPDFTISSDSEKVESDDDNDSEWSESGSYKSKNSSTKRNKGKRRRNSSTEKKFVPPKPFRAAGALAPVKKARSITFTQEDIFSRPGIFLPRKYIKHPPLKIEPQLNMANNQVKLFHLQQVKQLLNNRSQLSIQKGGGLVGQSQVGKVTATRVHKYNCKSPNCTSVFDSYMGLQEHIKLEDLKFPNRCKYCFWPYKTLQSKDTHERKYHTNIITISCEFCKQYFVKIEEIFLHLDSTHRYSSGEYYCSICSLYYQRGWSLLMHFMAPSHRQQESLLEASVNKIEVTPTIVNNNNFISHHVPPTNMTISSDLNYFGIGNTNQNQKSSSSTSWLNIPQLISHKSKRTPSTTSTTITKNKKIPSDSSISITPIHYQNQIQNSPNFNSNKSISITSMSTSTATSTSTNNSQSPAASGQILPTSYPHQESEELPTEMQTLIKKMQMDMEAKKWNSIPGLKPLPPDS